MSYDTEIILELRREVALLRREVTGVVHLVQPRRDTFGDMCTFTQLKRKLGGRIGRDTLYRLAQSGEIPARKIRGKWYFSQSRVEEWLSL